MTEYVEVKGYYDVAWRDEPHSPISGFFVYDGIVYEFAANASMTDYMTWDELHWDLEDSNSIIITDDRPELYADDFTDEFMVPLSLIASATLLNPAYVVWHSDRPESFEADWRDLNRDEKGRWLRRGTSKEDYTKDNPYGIKLPSGEIENPYAYGSRITLRELAEEMQEMAEVVDFDTAYHIIKQMLEQHPEGDTQKSREDLLTTIQDTRQVMEYNEDIGYDTDIQVMVDLLRQRGMTPPPQFEEQVMNRIEFEDEWAAENVPIPAEDYTYGQTYGRNIVLIAESLSSSGDNTNTMEFEARTKYDPSPDDVLTAHSEFLMLYPRHEVVDGEGDYLSYQSGSSNKQHYFFISRDTSGNYFAFNAWGSIGYTPKIHRIAGPTSMEQAKAAMRRKVSQKINRKGYSRDNTRVGLRAESFGSEVMEMTPDIEGYPGLPVIPDSFGTNSALESGQGVPVWYGSAETQKFAAPERAQTADELVAIAELNGGRIYLPKVGWVKNLERNYMKNSVGVAVSDDEGDAVFLDGSMATFIIDDSGEDDMVELSTFVKAYDMNAEGYTVQEAGLPVIPDSYGTDSATEMGGRGVPVWYGSAEHMEEDDWDRTEYEYKELEIAKPFGTGLKLGMGVVLAPVLVTFGGALLVMLLGGASDE